MTYALRHGHGRPEELAKKLETLHETTTVPRLEKEDDAARMESTYQKAAATRVSQVLDRMDREAEASGLHDADRQLLMEVVNELAPVAEGEQLADFVTRMVTKLAQSRPTRSSSSEPGVLDWQRWTDGSKEGFLRLKKEGLELPPEPESPADAPGLDELMRTREKP